MSSPCSLLCYSVTKKKNVITALAASRRYLQELAAQHVAVQNGLTFCQHVLLAKVCSFSLGSCPKFVIRRVCEPAKLFSLTMLVTRRSPGASASSPGCQQTVHHQRTCCPCPSAASKNLSRCSHRSRSSWASSLFFLCRGTSLSASKRNPQLSKTKTEKAESTWQRVGQLAATLALRQSCQEFAHGGGWRLQATWKAGKAPRPWLAADVARCPQQIKKTSQDGQ